MKKQPDEIVRITKTPMINNFKSRLLQEFKLNSRAKMPFIITHFQILSHNTHYTLHWN